MKITVLGTGSWGTALAQVLAEAGHSVSLWGRNRKTIESINAQHRNPSFLTGAQLSDSIIATDSFEEALEGSSGCAFVTPSKFIRETAIKAAPFINEEIPLIICSKGVEAKTGLLQSEILEQELGNASRIGVLSGPTHAEEVINRIESGAVCASTDKKTAAFIQRVFKTDYFRTYTSSDIVGVELCAAFKNVIAIAVGISYGIGMGDDTAAMLITRGLAEMSRMVSACGGEAITCMGLAGAGDMVVTCMSRHSRNRRFGQDYIACKKTLSDFEADTHMVVEGAIACSTLMTLSEKHNVELPITEAIRSIVWEGKPPRIVGKALIDRPLKEEFY